MVCQLPVKRLFEILGLDLMMYDEPTKSKAKVQIKTPTGYAPILSFVKKYHSVSEFTFGDISIKCSKDHLVSSRGEIRKIRNCDCIDTIDSTLELVQTEDLGSREVYDFSLPSPHLYVTPNGVVHHNTTLARVLFNELDMNDLDILEINASRTNSVDDVRDRIVNFVQMIPFGDFKAVLLDECLDQDTLVSVLRNGAEQLIPIKNLNHDTDLVKSYNEVTKKIEWKSFQLFDKGVQETISIEFDNGHTVTCTPDHKWYVDDNGKPLVVKASELTEYMHVLSVNSETQ